MVGDPSGAPENLRSRSTKEVWPKRPTVVNSKYSFCCVLKVPLRAVKFLERDPFIKVHVKSESDLVVKLNNPEDKIISATSSNTKEFITN